MFVVFITVRYEIPIVADTFYTWIVIGVVQKRIWEAFLKFKSLN
jgi:hypothetical protein